MPDAIITSTESTFGTISGTFAADQSTVTGTITGIITGTLDGSVGVPGLGVPDGGTTGQVLQKATNTSYDTVWATPSGGAWGTITGTLSNQTDLQTALNLKAPLASPALTGVPTAPTAATLTSTTQLATTAFVQQELLSGTANARNLEVYVRNQTGSTIPAGSIVYINGATGNRPTITLAQANNDANSAQTFGFTKTAIANNGFGFVIVRGELENIDTSALTEGVQLYLSPTTPGTWTTTKPSAPQHLVYVGIVVRAHPTQGVILVAVQNGYEVGEIHDIQLGTLANNDLLAYESSTDLWKNKSFGTLGLLTSADLSGYATESWVTSQGYITSAALAPYLLSSTAASTYQTIAGMSSYLTTSAAASTYYLQTNPAGYITSSALTGYATESFVTSQGYLTDAPSDGNQYARKDGAWDIVSAPASYITSVSSPLSVTSGDLSIDLSPYLTSATAASTYQTLSGMSSYLTTSAAASTYAPKASPALTGNVTITTNSTSPALFITQTGTGNILTLHDQASDTTFVAIDQNGKVNTIASTTANAGFNVPHGTAPTSPVNGDIWTTTSGLFHRQNGSTQQYMDLGGTQTVGGAKTFSNANNTFGNSTAAGTTNIASGATISGATKAVNLGTSGVAGSTTNITIGSTTGTSTTTLQGITNGVTQSAGDSSLKLATTAFVTTADNLKANLASPTFTGVPAAPTASPGTNTTQLATTAFVTAAVPAFGSTADIKEPVSTTKAASIDNVRELLLSPGLREFFQGAGSVGASGAGAAVNNNGGRWKEYVSPNAGVAGHAKGVYDTTAASLGFVGYNRGANLTSRSWAKKVWLSGRCMISHFSLTSYNGSANTFARVSLGGYNAIQAGDMVAINGGIGWKLQGGGSSALELQVSNGTTVTTVTSSFTPTLKQVFDWEIYSDGTGNVTLFVNETQVATTTGGPTGTFATGLYMEGVDSTASSTAPFILNNLGTKMFFGV